MSSNEAKQPTDEEIKSQQKWGYDLYPERKGEFKPTFKQILLGEGREALEKIKCEKRVYNCFISSK